MEDESIITLITVKVQLFKSDHYAFDKYMISQALWSILCKTAAWLVLQCDQARPKQTEFKFPQISASAQSHKDGEVRTCRQEPHPRSPLTHQLQLTHGGMTFLIQAELHKGSASDQLFSMFFFYICHPSQITLTNIYWYFWPVSYIVSFVLFQKSGCLSGNA